MKTINPNKTARIAGILYLLLIPLGVFGILYVSANLMVANDIAATIRNILANEMLFRLSIVSAILVQLVNIFVVLMLYKLLKVVDRKMALLMVIFFLVSAPMSMINELNHFAVLFLINTNPLSHDLVALFLNLHEQGIIIAQIFWGLWLFPVGYLVFKSGFIPKIIGILLMIGCFGYMMDSLTLILFPSFGFTFSEFTFLGEILLPLWLLIKGVNVGVWERISFNPK